jgi:L-malate glycosyltransferase
LRVALVNHSGEVSGAEVSLLGTADALRAAGIGILIVAPESGDFAARARAAAHDVRTVPFPAPRLTRNPVRAARRLVALAGAAVPLSRLVRAEGIDLVHANSVRAGLIASLGRPLHRRPVLWSVRDYVPVSGVGVAVRMAAGLGATRVIGNSNAISGDFARWRWLRRRADTVYPGVPASAFDATGGPNLRETWGARPTDMVVGCVGQIAPWKRVHHAIAAFRQVAERSPTARLVIVGAPKFRAENQDYLEQLRSLVVRWGLGARVVFAGFQEDIHRVFRSIDVLVHATDAEPFGRVLVEAMVHRVPVVAVRAGGIVEIVQDRETGFLVSSGDTTGMAARTLDLLRDEALRRRMGEAARDRAWACFRTEEAARHLVEIYRAVLAGRATGAPAPA